MATLIKHRNQYCSKIQKWNGVKQISTKIPLRTNLKSEALPRHKKVESAEKDIKSGNIIKSQFNDYFEWLNDKGTSTIRQLSVKDVVEQFADSYASNVADSSLKRILVSLNKFSSVVKAKTPIATIHIEDIESYKKAYKNDNAVASINLDLRNIKTFLKWCNDREMIKIVPKIKMLREPKKAPKYISEQNMGNILSLDSVSNFMKRAFVLYLSTGCRRGEIIEGNLNDLILLIPATLSKTRIEKRIHLNQEQAKIVKDVHTARDTHLLNGFNIETFKEKFTKAFRKACLELSVTAPGLKDCHLHCLRHTFAVVHWITSNDIYEVKNKLGHTSVKTTERYAQFTLDDLKYDFPTAYQVRLEVEKVRNNVVNTPLINTPFSQIAQ